ADLPQACEPGLDAEPAALGGFGDLVDFVDRERAGADEAHFAAEDIDELGEFVDRPLPQEPSEREYPRVALDLEYRPAHLVLRLQILLPRLRVGHHRPEFIHPERLAVPPAAHLR